MVKFAFHAYLLSAAFGDPMEQDRGFRQTVCSLSVKAARPAMCGLSGYPEWAGPYPQRTEDEP